MKHHISFDLEFKKNANPGKLIVIEGMDGAGKTLQSQKIFEELQRENKDVIFTKEPTDMPIGKFIRESILNGKLVVPPIALQYLFNADRVVHQEEIEKYLKQSKLVVMDRYFWSSVAYALADIGDTGDYYLTAFSVLSFYHRFLLPDITIYLDIPISVAMDRIKKSDKHLEIYDNEEKIKKIKKGYDFLLEKFPEEFSIVNADQDPQELTEEIMNIISKL